MFGDLGRIQWKTGLNIQRINCSMCKELVIEDKEKAEVLSASFASGFYC